MKSPRIITHGKFVQPLWMRYEGSHAGDKEFQRFPGFSPGKKMIPEGARKCFKGFEDGGGDINIRWALTISTSNSHLYFIFPNNNILHLQSGFFHQLGKGGIKAENAV